MFSKSLFYAIACGGLLIGGAAFADDKVDPSKFPPPSDKKGVTYAKDIQPIFVKSCYRCHSAKTAKPKGKLRVDTLEAVLKGGEDGPALIVGDSAKSVMVAQLCHQGDPDDYMPPPKNKEDIKELTKEQIGLIRAWIDQGAK